MLKSALLSTLPQNPPAVIVCHIMVFKVYCAGMIQLVSLAVGVNSKLGLMCNAVPFKSFLGCKKDMKIPLKKAAQQVGHLLGR